LAVFPVGLFQDLEILDVFQRTVFFFNRKKKQTKFGFYLSEKLDPENAY